MLGVMCWAVTECWMYLRRTWFALIPLTALKRDPFSGLLLFVALSGFVISLPQALLRFNSGVAAQVLLRVLVVA